MSTQYRLVQSVKTASGGCSAGPRFVGAVAPRIYFIYLDINLPSAQEIFLTVNYFTGK
jgi:hypothetical protein